MTDQSKQKKKIVIPGRPKKRLFLGMLSLATVLAAVLLYGIWYIASPGLANIAEVLPTIVGGIFAISVAISLLGILNMGLAVADWPYLPLLQRQTYELVNLLFPVSVRLELANAAWKVPLSLRATGCSIAWESAYRRIACWW